MRPVRAQDAYYTAQVIDMGETEDGRPFLVTEHVDGETLRAAVERRGPLPGTALHRLAIATMTALVAVHQAGGVHGEFDPGNVLLGPEGPRVINAGVAPALEAAGVVAADAPTEKVGAAKLAFAAPERFAGAGAGKPADVFAWASTMLFAATGRAPFEGESAVATMNRIIQAEPDLTALDEHLRGVIAACLDKDPAARPTAGEALLRLVGHSLLTAGPEEVAAAAPPSAGTLSAAPRARSWRFAVLAAAVGLVIAVASAGTVYALRSRAPATAAATGTPTPSVVSLSAAPPPSPPPSPAATLAAPGAEMGLLEHPADPLRVAAYRAGDSFYVRAPGSTRFVKTAGTPEEMAASPAGTWLALLEDGKVTFLDRAGGAGFEVEVGPSRRPVWSGDGGRLLLTTTEDTGKDEAGVPLPGGFAIIDVATRKVTLVDTDDEARDGRGYYAWLPDGTGTVVTYKTGRDHGMRVRDLAGREMRTLDWVGFTTGGRMFSPSGGLFATSCPSGGTYCVWDTAEGVRRASVALFYDGGEFWGWYDENHLLVFNPSQEPDRLVALDLRGKERRTLLTIAGKDYDEDFYVAMAPR
ncbi:protein kinase domain-containing protein [Thermocatellispora tengchongensis]|uniref:protein kinase domain-containing protein n=1 Tax=Thermocatellispora tengchongensis TaxID=1073253 RepID=UPI003634BFE0